MSKYVGKITNGSSVNLEVNWTLAGAGATNPTASSVTLQHEVAKDIAGLPITIGPFAATRPDASGFPLRWRRAAVTPTQSGRWIVIWTATVASGPTPAPTADILDVQPVATAVPTGKTSTY